MGCSKDVCTTDKIFLFINMAFAMYSGALLATAARLMWDPSTYTWFRFLCAAQYRVSTAYVFAAGVWLAALVYLAACTPARTPARSPVHTPATRTLNSLHAYAAGVVVLVGSEVAYGVWMAVSLAEWWRSAPQAELARRGMDLMHDIKPALLAVERYRDVARPVYEMIEEVESEAPNNVFVIIIFGFVAAVLQVVAFIIARRLARRGQTQELSASEKDVTVCSAVPTCEDDSDSGEESQKEQSASPGWRKAANLRMYTIIDKIF